MKKLFLLLLALSLLTGSASADALVPLDDSFWKAQRDGCVYLYRAYMVNSPEGYAAIWESPKSSRQRETVPNGTEVRGEWHYTDDSGEVWCAAYIDKRGYSGSKIRGWVKTSECAPVLDNTSFKEAYGQEFIGYDRAYDHIFNEIEAFVLWTYPCSGELRAGSLDAEWYRDNMPPGEAFDTCWRDREGRLWAYVGYCYGYWDAWVCLDDPANTELAADGSLWPEVTIYPPAERVPPPNSGVTALTVGAVAAVVIVTGGLLFVFFRKRKPQSMGLRINTFL